MKEKIKTWLFPWLSLVLTVLSALFWVALRVNHSGISKFLGADNNQSFLIMNLPVMVCVLAWLAAVLALAGLIVWKKKKWPTVTAFSVGVVMTVAAIVVVALGAKDYLRFIMVHFWESMAYVAVIGIFALLLFFPITSRAKWVTGLKWAAVAAAIAIAVVVGYELRPCDFTYGAVVYAVEDRYQIVFSTSDSAIAWVEIGGENYYDLYAGSMRSADKVHKVEVPQEALDAAGGYTVHAQQMIYRGPFGGYKGKPISRSYSFRAVDESDGIHYYALSDVHEAVEAAAKTAAGENLDFILLIGDLVSMVETEADAQLANELAHAVTGGECPVIYARGNHEIKGEYAEVLYKYVGSLHQSYYYWVTLGQEIYAVVLDIGEDHDDDYWEYYGTARFALYQQEQTRMLEALLEEGTYADYDYRMAICHVPIVHVNKHGYFADTTRDWTALLNEMGMDISLSGHEHELWPLIPGMYEPETELTYHEAYSGVSGKSEGGYLTDFRFPSFTVARRSLVQQGGTQSDGSTHYTCLEVTADLAAGEQAARYVNSKGEVLSMVYPFLGADGSFTELTLPLA